MYRSPIGEAKGKDGKIQEEEVSISTFNNHIGTMHRLFTNQLWLLEIKTLLENSLGRDFLLYQ